MLDRMVVNRPSFGHGYFALLLIVIITLTTHWRDYSRQFEEGCTMPLLANNATSRLAASVEASDTTISLQAGTGFSFPEPMGGDWFPLVLIKPTGETEIVHCTERNGDVLKVMRAREGTSGKAFSAGDRAEVRLTAGTMMALLNDLSGVIAGQIQSGDNAVSAAANSKVESVRSSLQSQIDGNDAAAMAAINTKFDKAGGTISGDVTLTGDIVAYRANAPTTGALFLGNSGSRYLLWDGSRYSLPGGHLLVNGHSVWTAGNFDPDSYLARTGGTVTGTITIQNTAGYITFNDTDWGVRHIHCNSGQIGFLNSSGSWACYSSNDGTFVATGNIGAYSDRKHKRDIRSIEGGLDIVEALRGVSYVRKSDGKACIGVIAQEVQEVVPEVVVETGDGLAVDYGNLVAVLIPAVQELAAKVRKLEGA